MEWVGRAVPSPIPGLLIPRPPQSQTSTPRGRSGGCLCLDPVFAPFIRRVNIGAVLESTGLPDRLRRHADSPRRTTRAAQPLATETPHGTPEPSNHADQTGRGFSVSRLESLSVGQTESPRSSTPWGILSSLNPGSSRHLDVASIEPTIPDCHQSETPTPGASEAPGFASRARGGWGKSSPAVAEPTRSP